MPAAHRASTTVLSSAASWEAARPRKNGEVLGADIESYLAEVVARLRVALGDRLVGAWLFGSGALGDFDPATSDSTFRS